MILGFLFGVLIGFVGAYGFDTWLVYRDEKKFK